MTENREIIIIAAMAENRVIGKNNTLPWSFKEDLAHFKALTSGWPCIMGRKTWESLPRRPLPGRLNIIVSTTLTLDAALVPASAPAVVAVSVAENTAMKIAPSLQAALEICGEYQKVFICGGASIYRDAFPLADKIELTLIHQHYEGDTFFPVIDPAIWQKTNSKHFDNFSFISYSKTAKEIP